MTQNQKITMSIVSHGQAALVKNLLEDIARIDCKDCLEKIILTINIPEDLPSCVHKLNLPLKILYNQVPKGFGENHNQAFQVCESDFFCVVNPDVRIEKNPFKELHKAFSNNTSVAIVSPYVYSSEGIKEDNIRYFPSLTSLMMRVLTNSKINNSYQELSDHASYPIDWAAGMFLMFRADWYVELGGFDPKYFLYYEDVDICLRSWKIGGAVLACPLAKVIHDAQRASHKDFIYFRWHLKSLIRYFLKYSFRTPKITSIEIE